MAIVFGQGFKPSLPAPEGWTVFGQLHSVLETNGVIFLGGQFNRIGHRTGPIVAMNAQTGVVETPLRDIRGGISALAVDAHGGVFMGGTFRAGQRIGSTNLLYLRPDGSFDSRWNTKVEGHIRALALHGDMLFVGGAIKQANDEPLNERVVAFRASTGELLPRLRVKGEMPVFSPVVAGMPTAIVTGTGKLVVHGHTFATDAGAYPRMKGDLGVIDVETWEMSKLPIKVESAHQHFWGNRITTALPDRMIALITSDPYPTPKHVPNQLPHPHITGLDYSGSIVPAVPAIESLGNVGDCVVEGHTAFLAADVLVKINQPNGRSVSSRTGNKIAALNLNTGELKIWDALAKRDGIPQHRLISRIVKLGDRIFIAGQFDEFGGKPRAGLAALDISTGGVTDWSPDIEFISSLFIPSFGNSFVATSNQIYMSNTQIMASPYRRNHLAAIDTATGRLLDWNPSPDGAVTNLFWRDGTLWVEGSFTNIAGISSPGLARLEPPNAVRRVADSVNATASASAIQRTGQTVFIQVSPEGLTGSSVAGRLAGSLETERVVLEASTNLVNWLPVATNTVPFHYEDVETGRFPYRFYRVRPKR